MKNNECSFYMLCIVTGINFAFHLVMINAKKKNTKHNGGLGLENTHIFIQVFG